MFKLYPDAEAIDREGHPWRGTLVAWDADGLDQLGQFSAARRVEIPSTAENEPWSGMFIILGARTPQSIGAVRVGQLHHLRVVVQTTRMDSEHRPRTIGGYRAGDEAPIPRWVAGISGVDAWPEWDRADQHEERSSPPSAEAELIAATTRRAWRDRALNLVEELAAECLRSDDDETRAAGHLAMAAVEGLRPYAGAGLNLPDRRAAWGGVITAVVDFIPKGREALRLAEAVRQLARAYGLLGPENERA